MKTKYLFICLSWLFWGQSNAIAQNIPQSLAIASNPEKDSILAEEYGFRNFGFHEAKVPMKRFLSVDPLTGSYPELTPYQFASNRPIDGVDLDGLEHEFYMLKHDQKTGKPYLSLRKVKYSYTFFGKSYDYPLIKYVEYNGERYTFSRRFADISDFPTPKYGVSSVSHNFIDELDIWLQTPELGDFAENFASDHEQGVQMLDDAINEWVEGLTMARAARDKLNSQKIEKVVPQRIRMLQNSTLITAKSTTPQATAGAKKYTLSNGNVHLTDKGTPAYGRFDFVITTEGKLLLGEGHWKMSNGAMKVQAAGRLFFNKDGSLKIIENHSGHYQPSVTEAKNFPQLLRSAGLSTKGSTLKTYKWENDKSTLHETTPIDE